MVAAKKEKVKVTKTAFAIITPIAQYMAYVNTTTGIRLTLDY